MNSPKKWLATVARAASAYLTLFTVSPRVAVSLAEFKRGWLSSSGWLESRRLRRPVDSEGSPTPWYTYSSIEWLTQRVVPEATVLEIGGGASTGFWLGRSAFVTCVESDPEWAKEISASIRPSDLARFRLQIVNSVAEVLEWAKEAVLPQSVDVLVIDGIEPRGILLTGLAWTVRQETGIIVLDNSERPEYAEGVRALQDSGWSATNFRGLGPINAYEWMTTVFQFDPRRTMPGSTDEENSYKMR
jgi:hypothetical protein